MAYGVGKAGVDRLAKDMAVGKALRLDRASRAGEGGALPRGDGSVRFPPRYPA